MNKKFIVYFSVVAVTTLAVSIILSFYFNFDDSLVAITFFLNSSVAIAGLISSYRSRSISMWAIFWFFNLVFLCLVPSVQYRFASWEYPVSQETMLDANLLIFAYMCIYALAYFVGFYMIKGQSSYSVESRACSRIVCINSRALLGMVSLSVLLLVFVLSRVGFDIRVSSVGEVIGGWGPDRLIGQFFLQPAIFFIFYLPFAYAIFNRTSRVAKAAIIAAFVPAILINFPTASSRFYAFVIYFPIILLVLHFLLKIRRTGTIFLFLMPMLLFLSAVVTAIQNRVPNFRDLLSKYLFSGHFDAYENFLHMIDFVGKNGVLYGYQLLGAIFFWVPRTVWPEKPIGTGSFLAKNYLLSNFQNISSPLIGEFYINFSVIGVLLIALTIGFVSSYFDKRFGAAISMSYGANRGLWEGQHARDFKVITLYPIIIATSLFYYRGDVMTATSSLCGILAAYYVVYLILFRKVRRQPVVAN